MQDINYRELKQARWYAHKIFDRLWRTSYQRGQAYAWLAKEMRLRDREAHISCFSLEQCNEVIRLVQELRPVFQDRNPSEKRFERRRRENAYAISGTNEKISS